MQCRNSERDNTKRCKRATVNAVSLDEKLKLAVRGAKWRLKG